MKKNNKRNFATASKTNSMMPKLDSSYKGFLLNHEDKIIYSLGSTDAEIRKGNEELLFRFGEIMERFPNYSVKVLHFVFLDLDT